METTQNQIGIILFQFGLAPIPIKPDLNPFETTPFQFRMEQYPVDLIPIGIQTNLVQMKLDLFRIETRLNRIEVSSFQMETDSFQLETGLFQIETSLFGFETGEKRGF